MSTKRPRSWRGNLFPSPVEHLLLLATAARPRPKSSSSSLKGNTVSSNALLMSSLSSSPSSTQPTAPLLPPYWLTSHQLILMRAYVRHDAKPVLLPRSDLAWLTEEDATRMGTLRGEAEGESLAATAGEGEASVVIGGGGGGEGGGGAAASSSSSPFFSPSSGDPLFQSKVPYRASAVYSALSPRPSSPPLTTPPRDPSSSAPSPSPPPPLVSVTRPISPYKHRSSSSPSSFARHSTRPARLHHCHRGAVNHQRGGAMMRGDGTWLKRHAPLTEGERGNMAAEFKPTESVAKSKQNITSSASSPQSSSTLPLCPPWRRGVVGALTTVKMAMKQRGCRRPGDNDEADEEVSGAGNGRGRPQQPTADSPLFLRPATSDTCFIYYSIADVHDVAHVLSRIAVARRRLHQAQTGLGGRGRERVLGGSAVCSPKLSASSSSALSVTQFSGDDGFEHQVHRHPSDASHQPQPIVWVVGQPPDIVAKAHALFLSVSQRARIPFAVRQFRQRGYALRGPLGASSSPIRSRGAHGNNGNNSDGGRDGSGSGGGGDTADLSGASALLSPSACPIARMEFAAYVLSDCTPPHRLTLGERFGDAAVYKFLLEKYPRMYGGKAEGGKVAGSAISMPPPPHPFFHPQAIAQCRFDGTVFSDLSTQYLCLSYLYCKFKGDVRAMGAWPPFWATLDVASRLLPFRPIPDAGDFVAMANTVEEEAALLAEEEEARGGNPSGTSFFTGANAVLSEAQRAEEGASIHGLNMATSPTEPGVMLLDQCSAAAAGVGRGVVIIPEDDEDDDVGKVRWYHSSSFPIPTALGKTSDADDDIGSLLLRRGSHFLVDPTTLTLVHAMVGSDGVLRVAASAGATVTAVSQPTMKEVSQRADDVADDDTADGASSPSTTALATTTPPRPSSSSSAFQDAFSAVIYGEGWASAVQKKEKIMALYGKVAAAKEGHGDLMASLVGEALLEGVENYSKTDSSHDGNASRHSPLIASTAERTEATTAHHASTSSAPLLASSVLQRSSCVFEHAVARSYLSKYLCRPMPMLSVRTGRPIPYFTPKTHQRSPSSPSSSSAAPFLHNPARLQAQLDARRYCFAHGVFTCVWGTREDYAAVGITLVEGGPLGLMIVTEEGAEEEEEGEAVADGGAVPQLITLPSSPPRAIEYFPSFLCANIVKALRCGYSKTTIVARYNGEVSRMVFGENSGIMGVD